MAKYKIIHNKRTNHPSIDVGDEPSDDVGKKPKWLNYEMTHSPTSGDSYQEIDNPNKSDVRHPKSYVRKYLRKDEQRHKGRRYPFSLSDDQESLIDAMLEERRENIAARTTEQKKKATSTGQSRFVGVKRQEARAPRKAKSTSKRHRRPAYRNKKRR